MTNCQYVQYSLTSDIFCRRNSVSMHSSVKDACSSSSDALQSRLLLQLSASLPRLLSCSSTMFDSSLFSAAVTPTFARRRAMNARWNARSRNCHVNDGSNAANSKFAVLTSSALAAWWCRRVLRAAPGPPSASPLSHSCRKRRRCRVMCLRTSNSGRSIRLFRMRSGRTQNAFTSSAAAATGVRRCSVIQL